MNLKTVPTCFHSVLEILKITRLKISMTIRILVS